MIYVPEYNDNNCVVVVNATTLRVYDNVPEAGKVVNYRDYYYTSHYSYTDNSTTYNQYSSIPKCLSEAELTTNYMYRTDIADIMLTFILIVGFIWFFITLLIKFFFKGFGI